MAKRLNISIPDDIHEKLQGFKNTINVSKICQEALAKEIREKRILLENPDTQTIIERLKNEKGNIETFIKKKSREDALEWVKTASYQNIIFVVTSDIEKDIYDDCFDYPYFYKKLGFSHSHRYGTEEDKNFGDGEIMDYLEKNIPDLIYFYADSNKKEEIDKIYLKEWEKTVKDFWKEIKDKL